MDRKRAGSVAINHNSRHMLSHFISSWHMLQSDTAPRRVVVWWG